MDRLIVKELVERKTCPNDRRKAEVLITEKGLNLLTEMDNVEIENKTIFKNISLQEAKTLNDLLDKLRG